MNICRVTPRGVEATTPYPDDAFRHGARTLDGCWDPKAGCWVFRSEVEDAVRALADRCYGTSGGEDPSDGGWDDDLDYEAWEFAFGGDY